MTNKFLLNLLGFNPDLTSRQPRVDSLSLVSRQSDLLTYLGRIAAILLLVLTIGVGNAWGADETFTTTSSGGFSNNSKTSNGITVTMRDGTSTNTSWQAGHVRVYTGGGVTISSSGNKITKIVFTCTGTKGNNYAPDKQSIASGSSGSYSTTTDSEIGTWTDATGATNIVFNANAQIRFTQIVVTYDAGCGGAKLGTPVVTATPTSEQVVLTWPAVSNASSYKLKWNGGDWENASSGVTKTGLTNGTTYTYQVKAIGDGDDYCDGDASASASVIPGTYYTVTWKSNGSTHTTTSVRSGTKPTFPDAPSSCDGTSTTFYGWAASGSTWSGKIDDISDKTIYTSASSMPNVTGAVTYHAVFAKATGSGTTTQAATISTTNPYISGTGWDINISGTYTYSGPYLRLDADGEYVVFTSPKGAISRFQFTYKLNSSTTCTGHSGTAWWIGDVKFYVSSDGGSNWSELSTKSINDINTGTGLGSDVAKDYDDLSSGGYNAIKVQLSKSCGNLGIKGLSATYANVTYSEYLTTCCTALGSINGSISLSQLASPDPTKLKATWTMNASTGISSYNLEVYNSSDVLVKTINGYTSGADITGLTPCTTYYVKLYTVSSGNPYCDGGLISTSSTCTTNGYTLSVSRDHANLSSGSEPSTICSNISNTYTAATGYALPTSITVTNAGAQNTGWTWNSGTGVLTINKANVTGNVSVTITPTCISPTFSVHPASADYTQGDSPTALSVTAAAGGGTLSYLWKVSTDGGDSWSNAAGTNNTASYSGASLSTTSVGTLKFKCEVSNTSAGGCSNTSNVATITIAAASNFVNGATVFIQAESSSAWDASACVLAWFNNNGSGGSAEDTHWLFDATDGDAGKKLFATVVPSSGTLNKVQLQRKSSDCSSWWNSNGDLTAAGASGSNTFRSYGASDNNIAWNVSGVTMELHGDPSGDAWVSKLADVTDQGNGIWSGTYSNYAPANVAGTSQDFKIKTNYNGWIGNTGSNNNATLDGMKVGSTYDVTATLDVTDHSLVMSKTFVKGTVSFDKQSHGGDALADLTNVAAGSKISAPSPAPTDAAYDFGGWFKEAGCTNEWNFASDEVEETMTLYAKWTIKTYAITYAAGDYGSGSVAGGEKTHDVSFTLSSSTFTRSGYTQDGWSINSNGSTKDYNMGGSYTANAAITLYPHWAANPYTITLTNEGADSGKEGTESISVTFNANTNLTSAITKPIKTGYRFDGYFTGTSGSGSQIIGADGNVIASVASYTDASKNWIYAGNVELHAKWTAVRTVTWSVNGSTWSSGVVEGNTHVISGEKVSALPTAPTSSDCDDSKVFVGWRATAIDGVSVSNPGSIFTDVAGSPTIDANKTFYAVFADESGGDNTLVTNVSELTAGTKVYIYAATSDVPAFTAVAKAYASGNNVRATSGSVSNNKLTPGENAGLYTIGEVTVSATKYYTFNDGTYYLRATGTSNNYLVGAAELGDDEKGLFSISISAGVFSITCKNTTVRGVMQFNKNSDTGDYTKAIFACYASADPSKYSAVQLFKKNPYVYSNYVTSCSSCDADATFTNTTPAVSDIDCTSATLTATGGLATVGADGCHVSDYGFVIGTSDNPAIGGSGVTKLQVGTSDPTIGEDFSYDATGLTKGTRYYVRAYATNRHGTAYSSSTNFWTNNVSSIAITTAPTKTNYIVGETFDATGMVVTATMASGSTENVTSDVTYSSSALTAGTSQNFAINYTLCETEKSVNQVINVYTLTVTEGTNPSYGTASGSVNIVSITGLGEHKTYTVTVTSSNATAVDNGDNTWTITNPTGNVAVRVDYAEAAQVKVYYKVDGVTVTGLTQDVYQSETTTLPTASELATAMTAQGMDIPDDDYPNFYGWSETEFPAQTAEPTIVTGTPTINAEKTYYAVYTNLNKKSITPSAFSGTYASNDGENTIDGVKYEVSNICTQSSKIQFRSSPGYLYSKGALAYIKKIEITGLDLIVNACSDNAGTLDGDAITPTGTAPYVYTFPASKQYFKIKGKGGTDKVSLIEIFYANTTVYYMTEFCATKVTLSHNSPEHGTVEFSRSSIATCGSDKNVSLTITPDAGYKLTGWTVNTASGYADAKTTSPAVVTTNNNSAAQNITLTFAQDANKNYDVTATFGLMTVESWTWTHNSAAIPNPLNLYIGQSARLDVAYTPAGVDNSKKTYTRTKEDAYINWVGVAQSTYTTISGRASTGENTTPVTFTHGDGPTTTVNVKVLPLPLVHFGDIVHNVAFDDVVATLSDNTLSPTKTTPTHADFDGATKNTCEEEHLHLVGWIREDWPSLVTYLNGGAKPSTDDITGAGNDGSGNAYFFTPGASINTQTFNGVTFYAVWAKVE